jgi:hypothetical protein
VSYSNATAKPCLSSPRHANSALGPTSSFNLKVSGIACMLATIKRAPVVEISRIEHFTNFRSLTTIFPSTDVRHLSERRRSMSVALANAA